MKRLIYGDIKYRPHALEVECHIINQEKELAEWCGINDVTMIAQSPLGYANSGILFDIPAVTEIAKNMAISPAQVLLAYTMSRGIIPIPSSRDDDHILSNFESTNINISEDDLNQLEKCDTKTVLTTTSEEAKLKD